MPGKLTLIFDKEKFSDFVDKLQDLTNISDVIKLKIDSDNILAYSMLSNDVAVLALKNYLLVTSDYITNFDSDKMFDYIITGAAKFVKNLKFFGSTLPIQMEINYKKSPDDNEIMHIRSARYSSGKLKISCIGGELSKVRDINKGALEKRMDIKNSKWGFKISKSDFADVKKLSNINSEDKVITVQVEAGKVSVMEEYKWELEVDTIENRTTKVIFNKKYLSNINAENEIIEFNVFETFILVKDHNSNLLLSFETDFEGPDN